MDQSWRLRSIQGNICPTCSISHFPFCPQTPAFNRNGFSLENDHTIHRPFLGNGGVPEIPRSLLHSDNRFNSMNVYEDSQNLYRDQNLGRDSFRQFQLPSSQMVDSISPSSYHRDNGSNLFMRGEPGEMERFSKRMKIDEMNSRSFSHIPPQLCSDYGLNLSNSARMSSEDERRLSLIRDHGGLSSALQSQGGTGIDSSFGTSSVFGREPDRYYNGVSLQERNLNYADSMGHAKFDDSANIGTDLPLKLLGNMRTDHLHRELDGYGQQHMRSNRNGFGSDVGHAFFREGGAVDAFLDLHHEEHLHSRNSQIENTLHPSFQTNGRNSVPYVGPNYVKSAQQSRDSDAFHGKEEYWHDMDRGDKPFSSSEFGNLNQHSHMSLDVPYHISGGSNEKYHGYNLRKHQPKDSMPANELQMINWEGLSRSNTLHHEQKSSRVSTENCAPNSQLPQQYTQQHPVQNNHDLHFHAQQSDRRQCFERQPPLLDDIQGSVGTHNINAVEQFGAPNFNNQRVYLPMSAVTSLGSRMVDQVQISRAFGAQPPLPSLPPPHTVDPPGPPASDLQVTSTSPDRSSLLFPIPASSSATVPLSHPQAPEVQPSAQAYFHNKPLPGFISEALVQGSQIIHETSSKKYLKGQHFPPQHPSSDKPKVIDASGIFKQPYRDSCPDHIVIILRGLPGSGKSYFAKMLRDLEVENGGAAPRIHSMDDYFMTEVEKVEESEVMKSSSSVRGKKPITKKVMEYCYEPEMEEAYRSSMLKAFKKTLEEGTFTSIIVDDRNLRVADFAQFWAIAKRSGYEVYLLEATYKDPVGCAARNVHGFTQDDIKKMAEQWEEAPPLYLQLDIQSLLHGDDLNDRRIQEVDMDTEDDACDQGLSELPDRQSEKTVDSPGGDQATIGSLKDGEGWDAEGDDSAVVKGLGKSKWSDDLDDEDVETPKRGRGNPNALSGLIQAYGKGGKSVHWRDKVGKTGFSIGALKTPNMSLVIGPGTGYNSNSNPLPEEEDAFATEMGSSESKRRSMFQEQMRAEHESF